MQNLVSQGQPEQLIKVAMQEYYRNAIDPAGWPGSKVPLRSQPSPSSITQGMSPWAMGTGG